MKPKHLKKLLLSQIKSVSERSADFCISAGKDFTRNRILSFESVVKIIIGMGGKNLNSEIIDAFNANPKLPSVSAFVQQRSKIKAETFKTIFDGFTSSIMSKNDSEFKILAVDGTDVQIATNPNDLSTFHFGREGQKPFNLLHLNALYDINQHVYTDVVIQGLRDRDEHRALQDMVDRSSLKKALVIADRGYESYNNMAHIQEKGWYFLIRIKDGEIGIKGGLDLPSSDEFDESISLKMTRRRTKEVEELLKDKNHYKNIYSTMKFDYLPRSWSKHDPIVFYTLNFRIVRFKINDNLYETVLTNLDSEKYPPHKLKELYASRWGIETSFRSLKYTVGLFNIHSKKVMCIHQEIYAHLIMYNFAEMITSHVVIKKEQRKYTYKANFSVAAHMCRLLFKGKTTSPNLETIISRNIVPERPNRHYERRLKAKVFHGFLYRIS